MRKPISGHRDRRAKIQLAYIHGHEQSKHTRRSTKLQSATQLIDKDNATLINDL